jgi:valyl-tRNA synthetase
VISDDEIVHKERKAMFYTFKYSADFPISISTTRPETKVGDTAVAVHPDDTRYTDLIGKKYKINFCGSDINIKIVADKHVDPEFGTGALGVTPAHSQVD